MASQTPYFTQRTDESKRQKSILVIEHHPAITELLVSALNLSEYGSSSIDTMDIPSPTGIENRIEASPDGIILAVDIRSMLFKNL